MYLFIYIFNNLQVEQKFLSGPVGKLKTLRKIKGMCGPISQALRGKRTVYEEDALCYFKTFFSQNQNEWT